MDALKNVRENYRRKCLWTRERKKPRLNFNSGLSANRSSNNWAQESSSWNPESPAGNPECKTVLDFLTWGETYCREKAMRTSWGICARWTRWICLENFLSKVVENWNRMIFSDVWLQMSYREHKFRARNCVLNFPRWGPNVENKSSNCRLKLKGPKNYSTKSVQRSTWQCWTAETFKSSFEPHIPRKIGKSRSLLDFTK